MTGAILNDLNQLPPRKHVEPRGAGSKALWRRWCIGTPTLALFAYRLISRDDGVKVSSTSAIPSPLPIHGFRSRSIASVPGRRSRVKRTSDDHAAKDGAGDTETPQGKCGSSQV